MKIEKNWLELWRELVLLNPHSPDSGPIKRYKTHARERRYRPDPLLDFIIENLESGSTVLDIGAGGGRWSIPLARKAARVTAVEPDEDMLKVLREDVKKAGVNVEIIKSSWEDAQVGKHDVVVCSHAMYSSPDLELFVRKMESHARKACYLAVRLPPSDGVIGELSQKIFGRPHDSVNAVVAFNALYSLGIYVNILTEHEIVYWTNDSLEEAFMRAKHHLCLEDDDRYDKIIRDTLERRLTFSNNVFTWPDGMRSSLLWWSPGE